MTLLHTIAEHWIERATEQPLRPWEAAFLRRHLAHCERCRGFAYALAQFHYEPVALSAQEAQRLRVQVRQMVAMQSDLERLEKASLALARQPQAYSPALVLGATALAAALFITLLLPEGRQPAPLPIQTQAAFHLPISETAQALAVTSAPEASVPASAELSDRAPALGLLALTSTAKPISPSAGVSATALALPVSSSAKPVSPTASVSSTARALSVSPSAKTDSLSKTAK
jgi:hypothetical protein